MAGGSLNDDGEYTPLRGSAPRNKDYKENNWRSRLKSLGLVILIALVAFLYFRPDVEEELGSKTDPSSGLLTPPVMVVSDEGDDGDSTTQSTNNIMYRPFCLVHDGTRTARILQTSMGTPSQQWAHIPCYAQTKESMKWASSSSSRKPDVKLNDFGAPDAIMQLNLSQIAHPTRTTPILGFGAAFTEAAALNYDSLSPTGKERLMELLYGSSGLGYSLGRVHINSCDFSVKSYSFDETDGDFELIDFDTNVTHDVEVGMIEMILRATSVFGENWASPDGLDGDFKMYASPWSPPAWMKAPTWEDSEDATHAENMTNSAQPSCLREGVGPKSRYAQAWALYFSKFITAYQDHGVPMWAVTVQNEPEFPAPWEACSYTPFTQADFVAYHLGPQLKQDHPDVNIFMFDHNKDHVINWAKTLLNATHLSSQYINGTSVHWYAGGMDRVLDGGVGAPNMHRLQSALDDLDVPNDHIVMGSEACHCPTTGYAGGDIQIYWARAERYAHTILSDLAAGSNGWVEWNLILDSIGGPNHLKNLCDAPILAVPHRAINGSDIPPTLDFEHAGHPFGPNHGDGRTREELNALGFPAKHLDAGLAVQPIYYYMGHISRYVRPGSRAVTALAEESKGGGDFRAFRSPGQVVAGGGMNDLARDGIELTAWPCEGSTRQQFKFNSKNQIQVFGHDWLGEPTVSCVNSAIDLSFKGITLINCNYSATFEMVPGVKEEVATDEALVEDDEESAEEDATKADEGLVRFVLNRGKHHSSRRCLVLQGLQNGGGAYGPRGGAQVAYGSCTGPESLWKYSEQTGEISSTFLEAGEVCMTTGWPFLQIGAFDTPNGESEKTVVILNEANEAANYVVFDADDAVLSGSIPPRSIQTILLDFD